MENLSEFVVRSPAEVLSLLTVGKKRLVFAETKMNRNSSRYENTSLCKLVSSILSWRQYNSTEMYLSDVIYLCILLPIRHLVGSNGGRQKFK